VSKTGREISKQLEQAHRKIPVLPLATLEQTESRLKAKIFHASLTSCLLTSEFYPIK
jgi:hypothetical protein